jgi:carbamate kinase
VCVVHGNGPQVGDELVRNEIARYDAPPLPLGVLVAATAGWIGYMVQQSLENALLQAGSRRAVATVITQVEVDPADPALGNPTKFIGHAIPEARARELMEEGVPVKPDGRGRLRRVVASPRPKAIHELAVIRRLVEEGTLVVACGGGGAPIYHDEQLKGWEGLDAVVDKDRTAAMLALALDADLLMILTDVEGVYRNYGKPDAEPVRWMTVADAKAMMGSGALGAGSMKPKVEAAVSFVEGGGGRATIAVAEAMDARRAFGEGSMAPKVRAAVDFVRRTGGRAIITELSRGREAVLGLAGTTITPEST